MAALFFIYKGWRKGIDFEKGIVLEDGRLVQVGNNDSLIQIDGVYRDLCEEQFGYVRLDGLAR